MMQLPLSTKPYSSSRSVLLFMISLSVFFVYLIISIFTIFPSKDVLLHPPEPHSSLTLEHVVFGVYASRDSWAKNKELIKLWWRHPTMRGCVFLDGLPSADPDNRTLPLCISEDTSRFRYTHPANLRSAVRTARIVLETVALGHSDARWYVFGDEDTIFFPDNLVKTLSKYDHKLWYYIGASSENVEQNRAFGFHMGQTGAGIAVSSSLAKVLAKVLDSCLERYHHLYGGDARIHACISELGVGLTHEPGFHQFDIRGDASGLLAAHPIAPLVSIHNIDHIDPIFPKKTTIEALKHLTRAARVDPDRILQQTVCYDRWFSWTISVSWGYAVQIIRRHLFLDDALKVHETFRPWKTGTPFTEAYVFNTEVPNPDTCQRPSIFFLDKVHSSRDSGIKTTYKKSHTNCTAHDEPETIRVYSHKLNLKIEQLMAPRRQCCDMLPSSNNKVLDLAVRDCKEDELIHSHL